MAIAHGTERFGTGNCRYAGQRDYLQGRPVYGVSEWPDQQASKKRMRLDLTEDVRNRLESLRDDTSADIALCDFVVQEQRSGATLKIETADGKQKQHEFL